MSNNELAKYFKSRNFFTPVVIEYGKISKETFYELSKGRPGDAWFESKYAITLANKNGLLKDGRDKCCDSYKEAINHLEKLKEFKW